MNVAGALNVQAEGILATFVFQGLASGQCYFYRCFIISIYALPRLSLYFFARFVFAFSEQLLLYKLSSLSFLFLFPNLIFFNAIFIPCSLHRPFIQVKLKREISPPPQFLE